MREREVLHEVARDDGAAPVTPRPPPRAQPDARCARFVARPAGGTRPRDPGSDSSERGVRSREHSRERRTGSAGGRRQPDGGGRASDGGSPRDRHQLGRPTARRAAASNAAVPRCTDAAARRTARPGGLRLLDDPPGVHDGNVVGGLRHHAEVVRDQHHRHAELVAGACARSARIGVWTVTSNAVVGSSAISYARLVRPVRSRSSRAGASRPTARAGTASTRWRCVRDRDAALSSSIARARGGRVRDVRPMRAQRLLDLRADAAAAGAARTADPGRPSRSLSPRMAAAAGQATPRAGPRLRASTRPLTSARARRAPAPSRSSPRPSCRSRTRRRSRACGPALPKASETPSTALHEPVARLERVTRRSSDPQHRLRDLAGRRLRRRAHCSRTRGSRYA